MCTFNGESEYAIMFGPDVCGAQNRGHVIFHHNGKNFLTKKEFPVPKDTKTHLYRLTVHPDQKPIVSSWRTIGTFYAPRSIADPNAKKPAGWVDEERIVDESHKKPENYNQIPRTIPDPEATQPEDWDTEADGDWEAPREWEPKMIVNHAYKGEWKAANIPNLKSKEDPHLAHYRIGGVGLDLWQVKSGPIFDDIMVTTDKVVADKYLGQWKEKNVREKELVAEIEAKAAKEKEFKDNEEKEREVKEKAEAEGDGKAGTENTFKVAEDVEAAGGGVENKGKKKKVESDGFDELDDLDEGQS
ncbi:hypothetical protein BGW39_006593 [Mortierella sp. 14UC]|nr:hypothetical protein BGW39_006593 [Mortierella sp. 14UC]